MTEPALSGSAALHPEDLLRIRQSCSHTYVPDQPAERGYRYVDVGGEADPFYLLRFASRGVSGAISLIAPIELHLRPTRRTRCARHRPGQRLDRSQHDPVAQDA